MNTIALANGWSLRLRQAECHDKLISAFKKGNKEFLIAAVCRFGKTITTLQSLRDLADETGSESQAIVVLCTMNVKEEWAGAGDSEWGHSFFLSLLSLNFMSAIFYIGA